MPKRNTRPNFISCLAALKAKVRGHYAEKDGFFGPEGVRALEAQLKDLGKDVEFTVHPGVDHAFFNDTGPRYNATAAGEAYADVKAWFGRYLG